MGSLSAATQIAKLGAICSQRFKRLQESSAEPKNRLETDRRLQPIIVDQMGMPDSLDVPGNSGRWVEQPFAETNASG